MLSGTGAVSFPTNISQLEEQAADNLETNFIVYIQLKKTTHCINW